MRRCGFVYPLCSFWCKQKFKLLYTLIMMWVMSVYNLYIYIWSEEGGETRRWDFIIREILYVRKEALVVFPWKLRQGHNSREVQHASRLFFCVQQTRIVTTRVSLNSLSWHKSYRHAAHFGGWFIVGLTTHVTRTIRQVSCLWCFFRCNRATKGWWNWWTFAVRELEAWWHYVVARPKKCHLVVQIHASADSVIWLSSFNCIVYRCAIVMKEWVLRDF